jgi:hypothetical protein
MRLRDLLELMERLDLGEPGQPRRPPRENLDAIKDALTRGLADADFRLDCIEHNLSAWREWERSGWRGMKPPIVTLPESGLIVTMFYWPPGEVCPAHEHTSWTMSAMFHNRLEVMTYHWDRALTHRRLERRSLFTAEPGRVGYIYDPAIHSPRNTFTSAAISFHIYNTDDDPVLEKQVGPVEGLTTYDGSRETPPRPPELFLRVRQDILRLHVEDARAMPCARTLDVLEAIHSIGDPITRTAVATAMRELDPSGADATATSPPAPGRR